MVLANSETSIFLNPSMDLTEENDPTLVRTKTRHRYYHTMQEVNVMVHDQVTLIWMHLMKNLHMLEKVPI